MSAWHRLAPRFAAPVVAAAMAAACTSTPPASPELMARCTQLYTLWARYEPILTLIHTGDKARSELALDDCRHGRYEAGLQALEKMLQRGRIPVPPRARVY